MNWTVSSHTLFGFTGIMEVPSGPIVIFLQLVTCGTLSRSYSHTRSISFSWQYTMKVCYSQAGSLQIWMVWLYTFVKSVSYAVSACLFYNRRFLDEWSLIGRQPVEQQHGQEWNNGVAIPVAAARPPNTCRAAAACIRCWLLLPRSWLNGTRHMCILVTARLFCRLTVRPRLGYTVLLPISSQAIDGLLS